MASLGYGYNRNSGTALKREMQKVHERSLSQVAVRVQNELTDALDNAVMTAKVAKKAAKRLKKLQKALKKFEKTGNPEYLEAFNI